MTFKYIGCNNADELIMHVWIKEIHAFVFMEVVFIDIGLKWLVIGKDTNFYGLTLVAEEIKIIEYHFMNLLIL